MCHPWALATSTQWGLKYLTTHTECCPDTAHAYRATRHWRRARMEVSPWFILMFWCQFEVNWIWKRQREREGWKDGNLHLNLFIIELQLCADRQPLFKQTPPFDSMLTWRHTVGMTPNIFSSSLYIYSYSGLSSWNLMQTQTPGKGLGMSAGSVKNVSEIVAW